MAGRQKKINNISCGEPPLNNRINKTCQKLKQIEIVIIIVFEKQLIKQFIGKLIIQPNKQLSTNILTLSLRQKPKHLPLN